MKNKKTSTEVLINVPTLGNPLLEKMVKIVNESVEIKTLWKVINVNAIDRLGMSDHGPVHFQIVANIALRLCRLLKEEGVEMSVVKNFGLSHDYAELIIFLGSIFHDLGMSISRDGHEEFSLFIANNILRENLKFLDEEERTIVVSETLHAIISHRSGGHPLTVEAGIVRVADALDMTKGRTRIPFSLGKVDIYSISATAIENVQIARGKEKPIQINILMNNSAGIFQVDELLKEKLAGSGIEKYLSIRAYMGKETENSLVKEHTF